MLNAPSWRCHRGLQSRLPGEQGFGPGLLATHCGGAPAAQTTLWNMVLPSGCDNVPLISHHPTTQVLATDRSAASLELIEAAAEAQGLRQLRSSAPQTP